jgi:predicted transposase YbfD/YdcC
MGREIINICEFFSEVETTKEHNGYFCSVGEALTVVIVGTLCGLRNVSQISQWADNERVKDFLARHFQIERIPCYYWLLCLLKLIKPESLNQCLTKWAQSLIPEGMKAMTLSFDGKTICSTGKMEAYNGRPLHIISAHLAELGITIAGQRVDSKSNEIPCVRELIQALDVCGCIIVADAMHCQKETAALIVKKKADYLLNAKDNQSGLKKDIEEYAQDADLRKSMDTFTTTEKNSGRVEVRSGFVTDDITWLQDKGGWEGLSSIGAIHRQFTYKDKTTDEWHYYISSRKLTAEELLKHARLEWSVESMHWLLDVRFGEDFCRIEDETVQQVLNTVRKIALNSVKTYKRKSGSKLPISKIMFSCLLDCERLIPVLLAGES